MPEVSLTKINPAFMTRQIAWMLSSKQGVQIHITSSNPLRPENKLTDWVETVLRQFEAGTSEAMMIEDAELHPVFRFMAPLKTEQVLLEVSRKAGVQGRRYQGRYKYGFLLYPLSGCNTKYNNADVSWSHSVFDSMPCCCLCNRQETCYKHFPSAGRNA
jgi:hypothetical protein